MDEDYKVHNIKYFLSVLQSHIKLIRPNVWECDFPIYEIFYRPTNPSFARRYPILCRQINTKSFKTDNLNNELENFIKERSIENKDVVFYKYYNWEQVDDKTHVRLDVIDREFEGMEYEKIR